jgi:hypothetical protein
MAIIGEVVCLGAAIVALPACCSGVHRPAVSRRTAQRERRQSRETVGLHRATAKNPADDGGPDVDLGQRFPPRMPAVEAMRNAPITMKTTPMIR